jgi:hypothetical protein
VLVGLQLDDAQGIKAAAQAKRPADANVFITTKGHAAAGMHA